MPSVNSRKRRAKSSANRQLTIQSYNTQAKLDSEREKERREIEIERLQRQKVRPFKNNGIIGRTIQSDIRALQHEEQARAQESARAQRAIESARRPQIESEIAREHEAQARAQESARAQEHEALAQRESETIESARPLESEIAREHEALSSITSLGESIQKGKCVKRSDLDGFIARGKNTKLQLIRRIKDKEDPLEKIKYQEYLDYLQKNYYKKCGQGWGLINPKCNELKDGKTFKEIVMFSKEAKEKYLCPEPNIGGKSKKRKRGKRHLHGRNRRTKKNI